MNKLLLLTFALVTISSCGLFGGEETSPNLPKKTHITLSGNIKNFKKKKIVLLGYNVEKKIKFNKKKKKFSCKLNLDSVPAGNYQLKIQKRAVNLYLDGKNDLKLILDFKRRNTPPKFKGAAEIVKINKYLVKKSKLYLKIIGTAYDLFPLEEKSFIKKMSRYKKASDRLLKRYKLEKSFAEKEKRNIQHLYNRNFNNYQAYYGTINELDDFVASNKIKGKLKNIDFNNEEDYRFSADYRAFLGEYFRAATKDEIRKKQAVKKDYKGDFDVIMLDLINKKVTNDYIKNILVYKIAKSGILTAENLDLFYDRVNKYSTDKDNKEEITGLFKQFKTLSKGMPSPKFGKLINYKGGKTSLDDLLGKGKYIYIDLWATWCSFCKKEIPILKNFEEKYHGKNIEFVSINVDQASDIKKWKKDIQRTEMGGVQLFAGQEQAEFEFAKKYLITGLPRFILLDPEGNIIHYNCPRPSEGVKLDNIFEELGIKAH